MPAPKIRDDGRIQRLISIAYLLSTRDEMHIDELIERTGSDRKTIESDLNTLMYIGLPPYSPGELFDIIIEDDFVSMYFNEVFVSPLRLSDSEKAQSVIALKKLESQVDGKERDSVTEVIRLLGAAESKHVEIIREDDSIIEGVRKAIESSYALEIEYLSLNSASLTNRIIEPIRLFTTASISYVYAYCRLSKANRIFRSDRILQISARPDDLFKPHQTQTDAISPEDNQPVFSSKDEKYVDLEISPQAEWILDTYPHENIDQGQIYRFPTNSAFFVARLILSYPDFVRYVSGTLDTAAIVEAITKLKTRIENCAEANP